ncbi:MAG: DNRLRE domain-containing protein [Verrucomicrobia bacterium]|nr:DNRLRE domain-containing protein [Verrucomicrobiota bacterium]
MKRSPSRWLPISLSSAWLAALGLAEPVVTLVGPRDLATVNQATVHFDVSASDAAGLAQATLYLGVPARTVSFSGPAQTEDAQITADSPDQNSGATLEINVDGLTPHAHGVLRFLDLFGNGLGQVPPGAVILSATLRVYCFNPGHPLRLYRLTHDWVEGEVTWNQASSGVAWPEPGANGSGSHAEVELPGDCSSTGWRSLDITRFVQDWQAGAPNYGIVMTDSGTDGVDFDSSEAANPPELTITFQPALEPVETQTLAGPSATVQFMRELADQQDYLWNCLVENASGQQAWAPTTHRLRVDTLAPDPPTLVEPLEGAVGISTAPDLVVSASDPNRGDLSVSFYGRPAGAIVAPFTVAVLPDTQKYVLDANYPLDLFTKQTTWIKDHRAERNIVFVTHEGDIVDVASSTVQWERANASLSILEWHVPYGLLPGNHDQPTGNYNAWFPSTRYQDQPWYGGHYGSDNDNNFQLFSAGGMDFLVLHLEYLPESAVVAWADSVLKTYPNRRAIVTTHSYLDSAGARRDPVSGRSMEYLWTDLVVPNPNVFLVLCGHVHTELRRVDSVGGRQVHQLLADYQDYPNGGDGWLRLLRFVPIEDKIQVQTFSPYLNQYQADPESNFELDYPMGGFNLIGTVTVASGQNASVVWPNLAENTLHEWYAVVVDDTGRPNEGPVWTFRTGADSTPPVIQGVTAVDVGETTARIVWTTDEPATSEVEYWVQSEPQTAQQATDPALVVSHSITLTGLTPGTTYEYRVYSADAAGNAANAPGTPLTTLVPNYDAFAQADPDLGSGVSGGAGYQGTTAAGDGLLQTITEAPNGNAASLLAEYRLHTTLASEAVRTLVLYFVGTWSGLDGDKDPLIVEIFNGTAYEDITSALATEGRFQPAQPGVYVGADQTIRVRFRDAALVKREKKDTLTIDLLYAHLSAEDEPPLPPLGLTAQTGDRVVRLDWGDNSEPDLAGYRVYRALVPGGSYSLVWAGAESAFDDSELVNGTTYSYVVTALDAAGQESAPSAEVSATPASPPPAVHVAALEMDLTKPSAFYQAIARVRIHDAQGVPVPNAVVWGDWYFKGILAAGGVSAPTDANGLATLGSPLKKARSGDPFRFVVTGVAAAGYPYNPSANAVSEGSVAVP